MQLSYCIPAYFYSPAPPRGVNSGFEEATLKESFGEEAALLSGNSYEMKSLAMRNENRI
jgi:hypothetical protein